MSSSNNVQNLNNVPVKIKDRARGTSNIISISFYAVDETTVTNKIGYIRHVPKSDYEGGYVGILDKIDTETLGMIQTPTWHGNWQMLAILTILETFLTYRDYDIHRAINE